jgi:phosphoribosylformylglycinamidine synthase subunit PurS
MPRVAIDVLLKREILDPQGRAVERALPGLGYDGVSEVRVGKHLELVVDAEGDQLRERVERMCADFLTNPVIESYAWRVIDEDERADHEPADD